MDFNDASRDGALRERLFGREEIFSGRILTVERFQAELPGGHIAQREIVRHPGAVAVAAVDAGGRVLLERQYRAPLDEPIWEVPAGKLDHKGEPVLDAAVRELEEETGYAAKSWRLLTHMVTSPGFCDERIALFLATDLYQTSAHPDEDELLRAEWVDLREAVAAIHTGAVRDAKTICALLLARDILKGVEV